MAIAEGAILVDARTTDQFDEAHIPGAISASAYDTGFATKVAQVVPAEAELIVVAASDGYELEAADLLASVGLRVRGFLAGGMTAWRSEGRPVNRIERIDPQTLADRLAGGEEIAVLDVRGTRVHGRTHPGLGEHSLPRAARAARRGPARRQHRHRVLGRQAKRPGRLAAPARGLRG